MSDHSRSYRRRRSRGSRALSGINLTSLLDVAFVLLIAFMLIAPTLRDGVDIRLPTVREAPVLPHAANPPRTVRIPDGAAMTLDGTALEPDALEAELRRARLENPNISVVLEADRSVPYQRVAEAVAAIRRAGIPSVGLPMVSLDHSPRRTLPDPSRP
jgi:biopolymer transport protein ExbD